MLLRIPARIIEHPVESLIAGVLLLGLLFGSADRQATELKASHNVTPLAAGEKM